jgi:hypothetical protein
MRSLLRSAVFVCALAGVVGCGNSSSGPTPTPTTTYAVGGTLTGLAASQSVVLQNNGGDNLTLTGDGTFTFPTKLADAAAYSVTVLTQPASQTCAVANGAGAIAAADVTNVSVTCTSTYTIGGAVTGLTASGLVLHSDVGTGEDLQVASGATSYAFATGAAPGTVYTITIGAQPIGFTCTLANPSGTMGNANVTNANVTCNATVLQRWDAPTAATWPGGPSGTAWADSSTMVEHSYFDQTTLHELKGGFAWQWQGSFTGTPDAEPTPELFTGFALFGDRYSGGPFVGPGGEEGRRYQASGNSSALDVDGDMIVCAIVKPYFDPIDEGGTLTAEYPIFAKGVGNGTNSLTDGGWVLTQRATNFTFYYEFTDSIGATHNILAFTPTMNADEDTSGESVNPPNGSVARRGSALAWPNNVSYAVVCAGRDGDSVRIGVNSVPDATFSRPLSELAAGNPGPFALDAAAARPATIGGYSTETSPLAMPGLSTPGHHVFPGRVYETAVWREAATQANIQAKLAAAEGLISGARYTRNREGPYVLNGDELTGYHTTWRHGPRIDPTKGLLFGLQGWNRVSFWMPGDINFPTPMVFAAGEDFTLHNSATTPYGWTWNGGATVSSVDSVEVPGDGAQTAKLITLPAGASLSLQVDAPLTNPNCVAVPANCSPDATPARNSYLIWDNTGPIHGQIWLRMATPPTSSTTLRVRYQDSADSQHDIDLSTLTANTWRRFWLNGLSTSDNTVRGTLSLVNTSASSISFYAWGLDLTQIGGGGDLGTFDPGPAMYDWSASLDVANSTESQGAQDFLQLPAVSTSTASTGFCLAVKAQPMDGLSWTAAMHRNRTAVHWVNDSDAAQTATIEVTGIDDTNLQQLCFRVTAPSGGTGGEACAAVPSGWTAGTSHTVKGCVTAAGQMTLYNGDTNTQLATASGVTVPNMSAGHLLVGNAFTTADSAQSAWQGYVSKALVCRADQPLANCE